MDINRILDLNVTHLISTTVMVSDTEDTQKSQKYKIRFIPLLVFIGHVVKSGAKQFMPTPCCALTILDRCLNLHMSKDMMEN